MTTHEKDALLGYLEFNLITMLEQIERRHTQLFGVGLNPEATGMMYDEAYEVLNEMERTLDDMVPAAVK
jgi:hypothetical protein